MTAALIGSTGFVGGTLARQTQFGDHYNSKNIEDIAGKKYSLIVCAGAPAAKWIANKEPEADLGNLQRLMGCIDRAEADEFILISTVDVYPDPRCVTENTPISSDLSDAYGRNRYELEEFVRSRYANCLVLRLPALFGTGLKKNFIYDLVNDNALDWTHKDSIFQFYDMKRLWADIETARSLGLQLVNMATEPVEVTAVARECAGMDFDNVTDRPAAQYDMHTIHAEAFGGEAPYQYNREYTLDAMRGYIRSERQGGGDA